MPCYKPHRVAFDENMQPDWKVDTNPRWWTPAIKRYQILNLPCRKCLGCKASHAREWSVRCYHEAIGHNKDWRDPESGITAQIPNSSVITLTYNPDHLPNNGQVNHKHFQDLLKRLRRRRERRWESDGRSGKPPKVRYFMCAEYGGKTARPHMHSIIFGETFDDRYLVEDSNYKTTAHSRELDSLWSEPLEPGGPRSNMGSAIVDDFTYAGAAYVAGYVAKKATLDGHTGPMVAVTDPDTLHDVKRLKLIHPAPEYRKMSNRPGLGHDWAVKPENQQTIAETLSCKIGEYTFPVPSYYIKLLLDERPDLATEIALKRSEGLLESTEEWTPKRCADAELVARSALHGRADSL